MSRFAAVRIEAVQSSLESCNLAADMLKARGFAFVGASDQSESCYYAAPGHPEMIRISAHKGGRTDSRQMGRIIAARITFASCLPWTAEQVTDAVRQALGRYFFTVLVPACPEPAADVPRELKEAA